MALTPARAVLFLLGAVAAAGVTAYYAGVFERPGSQPGNTTAAPSDTQLAAVPPAGDTSAQPQAPGAPAAPSTAAQPPAPAQQPPAATPPAESGPAQTAPSSTAPTQAGQPPAAEPPATQQQPAAGATQPAAPAPAGNEPAQPPGAAGNTTPPAAGDSGQPAVQAPSFDLVRVEGGGSIVIAGKAAAGAKVEVIAGTRVLGSSTAGPEGDFAIVLDEPLKPGAYQLVLRATGPGSLVAMSQETAVISVPDSPDGQVLALVEKPGSPSELITVPQPNAPAANQPAPAPGTDAATPPPPTSAQPPAAPADGGNQTTTSPPASGEGAPQPPAASPAPSIQVAVEAVEIEGRKIFVAGVAGAGSRLRVYANDIFLGETVATEGGRFLVETERDLAVGDYIIRVDVIGPDGVKVVARAAVPFEREPGENIAAVAPQNPSDAPAQSASGTSAGGAAEPPAPATPQAAAPSQPSGDAASTPAQGTDQSTNVQPPIATPPASGAGAAGSAETGGQPPAASAETPAAAQPQGQSSGGNQTGSGSQKPPQDQQPAASQPQTAGEQPATTVPTPLQPQTPAAGSPIANPETATPPAQPATPPATAQTEPAAPATGTGSGTAAAPQPPASTAEAPEVLSPKLRPADGAVIIRRGDTLWRISRRVYGFGTRYSTIYLANEEQIRDPDRIWPGQVFKVPEKSRQGESADMTVLGEQAVKIVPYNQQ